MATFFHKPENVLKRAQELLSIPNVDEGVLRRTKLSALEILRDALVAKKNRTWQPTHEALMIQYLDICLDLQLGRVAKDGLHQYRNLALAHNPQSLATVINHFVSQIEVRLNKAKAESDARALQEAAAAEDLEAAQSPEAVMLSSTTFDGSRDRTDREVVVPWLRFSWEAYRTVLDILKSNSKLEGLYKSIALRAFDFCLENNRKLEMRRVCEMLRSHLSAMQRHASMPTTLSSRQMRAWEGFTPESVEMLLEMRYRQLQVAIELEQYSEAFRTVEDISTVMNLLEQAPRFDLMVTYYDRLAQIFLMSKNYLFHAFALHKSYGLCVLGPAALEAGGMLQLSSASSTQVKKEKQQEMATRVVLAAMSIPLLDFEADTGESSVLEDDSASALTSSTDKSSHMATLLGLAAPPTRQELLQKIVSGGLLSHASEEAAKLFNLMEQQDVDPLSVVEEVQPLLSAIQKSEDMRVAQYQESLQRLLIRRVLFQLTRAYSSVTLQHLKDIFKGLDVTYEDIEQLIVRSRSLSTVAHSSAPSLSGMYLRGNKSSSRVESRRTKIRVDHVQQCVRFSDATELEASPAQLTLLGERLHRVVRQLPTSVSKHQEQASERKERVQKIKTTLSEQRQKMVERRELIERKRSELTSLQEEKRKTLARKRAEYDEARQKMERERLEQEARRREAEKKQKIKDEITLKETKQMLSKLGRTDLANEDLQNVDREKILNEAKEKAQKEKEEAQRKLKESARRIDHIIRATRETEQPILQQRLEQKRVDAKKTFEQEQKDKFEQAKKDHEHALQEKERLSPANDLATDFATAHHERQKEAYKKASEEQKKKKMLERLEERVLHARERYQAEQEEIRREQEEEERRRREEEEEKERQRQREVEEELRRQEEEEAEQKRLEEEKRKEEERREKEASNRFGFGSGGSYKAPGRRAGGDEGGWTDVRNGAAPKAAAAPEGRWERRGPVRGDEDGAPARGPGSLRSRIDRDREGGVRDAFGDRDAPPRRGLGDRDGPRRGLGDLDGPPRRPFGDRDGPRGGFGDRDGPRGGFGDRDGPRGGFGDRDGPPRRGFGDRDGPRGGSRRPDDREPKDKDADDRFFGRREGSYRPPGRDGGASRSSRAPESGRWR